MLRLVVIPTRSPGRRIQPAARGAPPHPRPVPASPDHRDADRLEPEADVPICVAVSSGEHDIATHTVNRHLLDAPVARRKCSTAPPRQSPAARPLSHAARTRADPVDPALSPTRCATAPAERLSTASFTHAHGPASATFGPVPRVRPPSLGPSSWAIARACHPHGPLSGTSAAWCWRGSSRLLDSASGKELSRLLDRLERTARVARREP